MLNNNRGSIFQDLSELNMELVHSIRGEYSNHEKPYKLQYDPGKGIPQSNYQRKTYCNTPMKDSRKSKSIFIFDRNESTVLEMKFDLPPSDFNDDIKVKQVHYPELKTLIRKQLSAVRVDILQASSLFFLTGHLRMVN